jgi:CRISPR-associated protein Cas2
MLRSMRVRSIDVDASPRWMGGQSLALGPKICQNFGNHLQFSVFECDLNPTERIQLERQLGEVMKLDEDQALFVSLDPSEGRGDRVIAAIGLPYTRLDEQCYVV